MEILPDMFSFPILYMLVGSRLLWSKLYNREKITMYIEPERTSEVNEMGLDTRQTQPIIENVVLIFKKPSECKVKRFAEFTINNDAFINIGPTNFLCNPQRLYATCLLGRARCCCQIV